jgi:hypothetical protein
MLIETDAKIKTRRLGHHGERPRPRSFHSKARTTDFVMGFPGFFENRFIAKDETVRA